MSEELDLIAQTAERIFKDLCTQEVVDAAESGTWPEVLWNSLEESGLTLAAIPEEFGGVGAGLSATMAVLQQAGRYAAPLPLAETFVAGMLLSQSGLRVPSGPLSVADSASGLRFDSDASTLSGKAEGVAWASQTSRIAALVDAGESCVAVLFDASAAEIVPGENIAGEPRDGVTCDAIRVEAVAPAGPGVDAQSLRRWGALCRCVQMAGALESVLSLSIEHANVRAQFGRPIASFQAIRQQIAEMAGEVAAASKAAQSAVSAAESGDGAIEIAAAKGRIGEAAGNSARIAHQVHGAMGITHEHKLHQFTRRLWSWRDEFGDESEWYIQIGRQVATAGSDGLWSFISQT